MKDLTNATVEDVKAFHHKFYSPNNATLVVAGDIDKAAVKTMIEKYFGEIAKGEPIGMRKAMPVSLPATVKLYQEDNFAKVPMLTIVFPTEERYSKDAYALNFLGELMAGTKKSPLYTILVKNKKLTSRVMDRNGSQELAGSREFGQFIASSKVRTNSTLKSVAIFKTEMGKIPEGKYPGVC